MLQDLIQTELLEKKTIGSFVYLIENGREIEFAYNAQTYFISRDGAKKHCSIWIDKDEQSFDSIEELLLNGLVSGKKIYEIWDEVEVLAIY